MKPRFAVLSLFLFALLLSACAAAAPEPTATPNPTETPQPSQTPEPTATSTLTPEPTEFVYAPVDAKLTVSDVNMRLNPGGLFGVKQLLARDTIVKVLGKSQGGDWFFVETPAGSQGWVYGALLEMQGDSGPAPVITTSETQLVTGQVLDESGQPVSGIQFSLTQDTSLTTAVTDAQGNFYAYFPDSSSGMWAVVYTAISCTSNQMDENCNCLNNVCKSVSPSALNVILPQSTDLTFTWK